MRVLVTGGAGTIGSELVRRCLASCESIHVLDTFATSRPEHVPADPRVQVREGSIADADVMAEVFEQAHPDVVVHAAASYADPTDWEGDTHTNVIGAINVARGCAEAGARLVNLQTVLCYGRPDALPITETAPLRPQGSYAITKVAAEQLLTQAGLPVVSLRVGSVLSLGLSIGAIPAFYRRLTSGHSCQVVDSTRDYLDPDDFFALLLATMRPDAPTGTFNVSTGIGHSTLELYRIVADHLGVTREPQIVPPPPTDIPAVVLDSTAVQEAYGWQPQVPFEVSMQRLLAWYDEHGITDVYSHHAGAGRG